MIGTQRLTASLTPLDAALAALLDGLKPVAAIELALVEALGCVAAAMPPLKALPAFDVAAADGWAFCARDLVGASSYSPLPLAGPPVWVEAGDRMPDGCDCVIDSDSVEQAGPLFQVSAEAIPGQGVRRAAAKPRLSCCRRTAYPPARSADRAHGRAGSARRSPPAAAPDQRSGDDRERRDGAAYRRERPRGRCRNHLHGSRGTRRAIDRSGVRGRTMRSAGDGRRHRRRPHRCDDRGAGLARHAARAWDRAAARPNRGNRQDRAVSRYRLARRTGSGAGGVVDAGAAGSGTALRQRAAANGDAAARAQDRLRRRHRRNRSAQKGR